LSAGIATLRDAGPSGLTVRAVAAAAGCSTMAVYTHFSGKSGLVDAIVAEGHAGLNAALQAGAEANGYGDELVSVAMAYREWALRNPTHYQAMYLALVPKFEASAETKAVGEAGFVAHRERVSEALGVDLATADRVARHLWWAVHGHVQFELLGGAHGTDDERTAVFLEAARWLRRGVEQ